MAEQQQQRYVIKLGLYQPEEEKASKAFFRRFTLDGLGFAIETNCNESNLIKALDQRALDLAKAEAGSVKLFYMDADDDFILIGNDQDIYDALLESSNKSLKVYAEVKEEEKKPAPLVEPSVQSAPVKEEEKKPAPLVEPSVQSAPRQTSPVPSVVDALADVLSSAAEAANAGVEAMSVASETAEAKRVKAAAKEHFLKMHKESKLRMKEAKMQFKHTHNRFKADIRAAKCQMRTAAAQNRARAVQKPQEPLFIHGRHTCDQCLTTPILGKRFHAVNLPDYDLCEKCFGNYKGVDIKFEEVKLDRDVGPQLRWRRKYHSMLDARRPVRAELPELQPPAAEPVVKEPEIIPSPAAPEPPTDHALEEAIRRSLETETLLKSMSDETKKETPVKTLVCKTPDVATTTESESEYDEDEKSEVSEDAKVPATEVEEPDIVVAPETKEEEPRAEEPHGEEPSSPKAESFVSGATSALEAFVGETLDRMGEAIEDLNEQGATIVDGEEDEESQESGGWSVVHDEGLAHGASVIGSALYNSDNNVDEISDVTSVPTEIHSIAIPQPVLDRWAEQLAKLHEMGYLNDARSVEILEKLAAANIGVGSTDEVSVQQVVNRLEDY